MYKINERIHPEDINNLWGSEYFTKNSPYVNVGSRFSELIVNKNQFLIMFPIEG